MVKAKAKAKAKPRAKKVVVDKYAQLPRSLQTAAKALDERDLTARIQNALNARRHRDERAEDVPEHRGPVDMRHLGRVVDRVAGQLRSPSPMSVTPSARLHAAFAAMRGRPPPSDDEF
jgi:hypothetical protein